MESYKNVHASRLINAEGEIKTDEKKTETNIKNQTVETPTKPKIL